MNDLSFEWVKEVDYEKLLDEEYIGLIEEIGLENTIKVIKYWNKIRINISEKTLLPLKKAYILKNKLHLRNNGTAQRRFARKLEISERYIQQVIAGTDPDTPDLFEYNEAEND